MGNVQMEARQIRYGSTNVEAALNNGGGGGAELESRVEALEAEMEGVTPLIISTTPTKIGKWGNDDLYAVYVDGGTVSGTTKDIPFTLQTGATIRGLNGALNYSGSFFPLSFFNTDINYSIGLYFDGNNSVIKFASKASQAGKLDLIVLYSVASNDDR